MDDLIAFAVARLDEEEATARGHLCINCGVPVIPLRNEIGTTGYTHNGRDPYWQGRRCQGTVFGAEPVQNPVRVLREVEARRQCLALYLDARASLAAALKAAPALEDPASAHSYVRERINVNQASGRFAAFEVSVRLDAVTWNDHPDYRPEWKP